MRSAPTLPGKTRPVDSPAPTNANRHRPRPALIFAAQQTPASATAAGVAGTVVTHLTPNSNHMSDPINHPTQAPSSLETVIYRLGSVEMHLGALSEKLDAMNSRMLQEVKCPQPGACVSLLTRVGALEDQAKELFLRIGALERAQEYSRGFGRGMIFAVGALGGVLGAFGGLLLRKVFGGP